MSNLAGRLNRIEKKLEVTIGEGPAIPPNEQLHVFYSDSKSPEEVDREMEEKKRELVAKYGHCRGVKFLVVQFVSLNSEKGPDSPFPT